MELYEFVRSSEPIKRCKFDCDEAGCESWHPNNYKNQLFNINMTRCPKGYMCKLKNCNMNHH